MKKPIQKFSLFLLTLLPFGLVPLTPAQALFKGPSCFPATAVSPFSCSSSMDISTWWNVQDFTQAQKSFLTNNFYQDKIINELWTNNVDPALKALTAQMAASQVHSTGAIGGMMDGLSVNEAMLASQTLQADAYRDYTPGEGLCRFGTNVRSLAAAQEIGTTTQLALAKITEDRMMGKMGAQSAPGNTTDRLSRFKQFQNTYCNPGDNNGFMKNLCYADTSTPSSIPRRFNKDIDYARTVNDALTLNVDFTDGALSEDEEDILALSSNLYGHDLFDTLPPAMFQTSAGAGNKQYYLDVRQIAAMRGLAQNSFNTLVATRASGNTGTASSTAPYMKNILMELGVTADDAATYLGSKNKLSYAAQMEILTKKIYQNPNFYTNLIDKPANVKRQIAAMKAIDVTQNRDIFESLERQELLLSALLELEIRDEQQRLSTTDSGVK